MTATLTHSDVNDEQTAEQRWLFDLTGMDCGDCARTIEAGVRRIPGVESATVNFGAATLTVVPADHNTTPGTVVAAVQRAGYRALPRGAAEAAALPWWHERRVVELAVASLLWGIGFAFDQAGYSAAVLAPPYLAAMALAGYPIFRAGWFALQARRADMNLLMSIAAIGAIPLGEWAEAASVMILFSLGLLLQSRTIQRTRNAIQGLLRLAPDEATLVRDGAEQRVSASVLVPGDVIRIRPGERIAADAELVAGHSEVDQSAITGESVPVAVEPGSSVFAGTINGGGAIDAAVTKLASESTLAGIVHLVEQAQSSRAPVQTFVDRFAAIYTPLVVFAAVALAAVGAAVTGDVRDWVFRGLVLLVVACPCALVISTPVALVASIGSAARRGVLFKGGAAIESLARVRTIAFDKTGTITHGRPVVTSVVALNGVDERNVLSLAAAVEIGAAHPIARGIIEAAHERGIDLPDATNFRSDPGRGATAHVDGAVIMAGNPRSTDHLTQGDVQRIAGLELNGETVVVVTREQQPIGLVGLTDPPRSASADAIRTLHQIGLRTVMVSGDNRQVAERIGQAVGISDVCAELLPAGKVDVIRELAAAGDVAMVGDGINDAPALAAASTGIAMGVAGSDVAIEAADVALLSDDLRQLPVAIQLSRGTMRIIRQNVAFALIIKLAFVALTVAGVTNLWLAVAADVGASLLVTLNAMRLMRAAPVGSD